MPQPNHANSTMVAVLHELRCRLPGGLRFHAEALRLIRTLSWPCIDLGFRLWLAQLFFASGLIKVGNWQTALYLSANEYPVSWLDPVTAAYIGAAIEVIAPVFLALGLMTRYAALPLLILTLVIQFSYRAFDSQLCWAVLFGWYVVHGASTWSLDNLLRRGIADSALPLAPTIARAAHGVRLRCTPMYLNAVRVWFALTLLQRDLAGHIAGLLPLETAAHFPPTVALSAGALLLVGVGTRYVALVLMLGMSAWVMMDSTQSHSVYLLMTLWLLLVQGSGSWSVDNVINHLLRRRFPELDGKPAFTLEGLPQVVIVGAGFAGLTCAAALRRTRVAVTLIDRANYHLFQPLLYQVATAAISPSDIASPIRSLFRDAFNTRVLLGTVSGVDTREQIVIVGEQRVPYDYLVLATGATHSYFGKEAWDVFAPGLKRIEDATEIRRRLLIAFERAEMTEDPVERSALLTFLIVGGGPTGVELAGAIAELSRFGMEAEFRKFDPAQARVILVQSGPRVLPTFDEKLSMIARRSLEALGVEVRVGGKVEDIDAHGVLVNGERIHARTVLWAAGVTASPAATWLGVDADNAGRIKVGPDLSIAGLPTVFVAGDTAHSVSWNGQPAPGLAPAAKQGGAYIARVIRAQIEGLAGPAPFVYRHRGSLATIGRKAAVADFGFMKLWGAPAWWLWGIVHVGFLVGVRNRISTMVNWFWSYLTFGGGIRLITGTESRTPLSAGS